MITETRGSRKTRWRKTLLIHRQSLLPTWHRLFPAHEFESGRLRRYHPDTFDWLCERAEGQRAREPLDRKRKQLRRLLADDISLDRAWAELNAPEKRPTAQVTVEAIWQALRERGLGTLKEAPTKGRLAACDNAARAEIERRILRNFGRA
jgi:hypothetical protein